MNDQMTDAERLITDKLEHVMRVMLVLTGPVPTRGNLLNMIRRMLTNHMDTDAFKHVFSKPGHRAVIEELLDDYDALAESSGVLRRPGPGPLPAKHQQTAS